ncbi:MAG: hypothetical protein KGN00_09910 [Chloroflexota bacterium]|nr:hypothetical protein [Chloroflexota bacterium]MDE3193990.1 hypothetical protein [Chloroflexota bacterium]
MRSSDPQEWIVRALWAFVALGLVWVIVLSGTDTASTILFSAALVVVAPAFLCFTRAISSRRVRARIAWTGRALALVGTAVAIAFPGILYGEVLMLLGRGQDPSALVPGIVQSAVLIPATAIPALLSLRWTRLGGYLFLLNAALAAILQVDDPFGAFPDRGVLGGLVFDVAPRALTAVLLTVGGMRPSREGPAHRPTPGYAAAPR